MTRGLGEHARQVGLVDAARAPRRRFHQRLVVDVEVIDPDPAEVVLQLPVPERPEDPVGNHRRGAGCLRVGHRVELDEPQDVGAVAQHEAGTDAGRLGTDHRETAGGRSGVHDRTRRQGRIGQRRLQDPVGEPLGVGHLVGRVHVQRAQVPLVTRSREQVEEEVVGQRDVPGADTGRVLRGRLAGNRIVGEERRCRRAGAEGRHEQRAHDRCRAAPAAARRSGPSGSCRHQNGADVPNTTRQPSEPLARSRRRTVALRVWKRTPMP